MCRRAIAVSAKSVVLLALLAVAVGLPAGPGAPPPLVAAGPATTEDSSPSGDDGQATHTAMDEDSGDEGDTQSSALPLLGDDSEDDAEDAGDSGSSGSGGSTGSSRPRVASEPRGPADRVSPPSALVRPTMASASVSYAGKTAPLIVPDEALPWQFWIERELAQRLGTQALVDAVGQWDGITGSRWSTDYVGEVADQVAAAEADNRSVVFAEADCPAGVGGYAYWQTATATPDNRYGQAVLWITEVDIGICPAVRTTNELRSVLAHEVGHALGLEHLCDPGQRCWQPGMGDGPHGCRVMYAAASSCERRIAEPERTAAVHQYPTLRRLAGPTRVETAARASYASYAAGTADAVVVARADQSAHGPLAAAALSAAVGGPMLLGVPSGDGCLSGAAAEELARVAARDAAVTLVGDWPRSCEQELSGWDLSVERIAGAGDPIGLGVAVAQRLAGFAQGDAVFVVSAEADAGGHVPDGVAAGAAAGANGAPVLYTDPEGLSSPVGAWLRAESGLRRAYVMGGSKAVSEQVVADLRDLGLDVVRISGATRVETALALASRTELFGSQRPVVLAAASSWADAVTGSATGARAGAPVLVTPDRPVAAVERWLATNRPGGGFVVGGSGVLSYELQWRYTRHVR